MGKGIRTVLLLAIIFTITNIIGNQPTMAMVDPNHKSHTSKGNKGSMITSEYTIGKKSYNDIPSNVLKEWNNKAIKRGYADRVRYPLTSGRHIVYDIYAGTGSDPLKSGFREIGDKHVSFDGWAILKGYHHHTKTNQATYIGLVNIKDSSDRYIYKAAMRNAKGNLNEEMDEVTIRGTNSSNPSNWKFCADNVFNIEPKGIDEGKGGGVYNPQTNCNMKYEYTQFRAYFPVEELFEGEENENKKYKAYIIKEVEDHLIYDELVLPFGDAEVELDEGTVRLSSGRDDTSFTVMGKGVIKTGQPNGVDELFPYSQCGGTGLECKRYFQYLERYKLSKNKPFVNDGKGVNVYYKVYDPVLKKDAWIASGFVKKNGEDTILSYEKKAFDVVVEEEYIDISTGRTIKKNKLDTFKYPEDKDAEKRYHYQELENYIFVNSASRYDKKPIGSTATKKSRLVTIRGNFKKVTLIWYVQPLGDDGGSGICIPTDMIGGNLRYDFEIDLLTIKIEGETVEQNDVVTTPVTVFRKDFSQNRDEVREEISNDIKEQEDMILEYEEQIRVKEAEISVLEGQLSVAEEGYLVTKCGAYYEDEDGNMTRDCSKVREYDHALISSLKSEISRIESEIKELECDIEEAEARIKGFEKEMADLKTLEDKYKFVSSEVSLTFISDGGESEQGIKNVTLQEGEEKMLEFAWAVPSDGYIRGEVNPKRNLGIDEVTYDNNILSSPIYVASHEMAMCLPEGQVSRTDGIVRVIVTEDDVTIYKEYVDGALIDVSRKSMRAGTGFTYKYETNYFNEDPMSNVYGFKKALSYFKDKSETEILPNYLPYNLGGNGYEVEMQATYDYRTNPPVSHEQYWELPEVMVEKKSGNVFEKNYTSNPNHNHDEEMMYGGRYWYTPFKVKDGIYDYMMEAYDAGVNKLGVCNTGKYEVYGTVTGDKDGNDDFVRRTVSPNNPFPSGTGWNWIGNVELLTNLKNWWNNTIARKTGHVPEGFDDCYFLDEEAIKRIQEYNKKYGLDAESYLPNGDRFWKEIGPYLSSCPSD